MVLGALLLGGLGFAGSFLQGQAQSEASQAQYEEAERQAKARHKRDVREWKINNLSNTAQWWWDKARVEQLRFNERQKASDAKAYQASLIKSASRQLGTRIKEINARTAFEQQSAYAKTATEYPFRMESLAIETLEATRQYLNQVNQQALQADQLTNRATRETDELIQSLVLEERRDKLGWELNKIQSLLEDSKTGARAVDRQGGGSTSKLLMMQAAKQLGRTWGELENQATSRQVRQGLLNTTLNGEYAKQLGIYALSIQDSAQRARFAIRQAKNQEAVMNKTMKTLTIPEFRWRERIAETQRGQARDDFRSATANLNRPYRKETFFEPLKPVRNLRPKYIGPSQPSRPSLGLTIGNAILAGASGAMQASYRNDAGQLQFY